MMYWTAVPLTLSLNRCLEQEHYRIHLMLPGAPGRLPSPISKYLMFAQYGMPFVRS